MSERICGRCGESATGYASIWTAATGDVPYCHGDDDQEPTCYEQARVGLATVPDAELSGLFKFAYEEPK